VTVETADLTLDGESMREHPDAQSGPYVMLAVSDTGHGMDAATQQRIFEPFFTTKDVGKGTGLGLSMVYGFVKQSGGLIYVYSEPNLGTTFKIYLPRVSEDVASPEAAERPAAEYRGTETVLVVEDDEAVRSFLVRVLRCQGYTVEVCGRPAEALALSDRHPEPIHLLVTDVIMPQMGGAELARQLQSRRAIKVLFISGYTENAIVHHGELDVGVNLLTKPFSAEDLAVAVRRVLDQGK
jgi:CheY-like chemotaxis protein